MLLSSALLASALLGSPSVRSGPQAVRAARSSSLSALTRQRALEDQLLSCTSGKQAIAIFEQLEALAPPAADLLASAEAAAQLDGRWVLQATVAAQVGRGSEDLADFGIDGAVNGVYVFP